MKESGVADLRSDGEAVGLEVFYAQCSTFLLVVQKHILFLH